MTAHWTVKPFVRICGSRGCEVPAGQPMRHLAVPTPRPWCAACALRVFGEEPPNSLDVDPPSVPVPSSISEPPLRPLAEQVRERLLVLEHDVKRKAAGDD